ncbi:hypothetical protein HZ326_13615 [Fusarium oxysporum f. sp. albedinis]|nr:hypothetical protein HZ326_13615 [Fusarium oxysporum f. sp. albedinis]
MTSHLILPAVSVRPLALGLWVPVRENVSKAQIPQKDPRSVAGEAWTMGTTTPGKTNPHVAQAGLGVQPSLFTPGETVLLSTDSERCQDGRC